MRPVAFLFVLFFSFSLVSAYAGLPPILEYPGEPVFPVPPLTPREEAVEAAAGVANAVGMNETLPSPGTNASVTAQVPSGAALPVDSVVSSPQEGVNAPLAPLAASPLVWGASLFLYAGLGVLIVFAVVLVLVLRRRHEERLPVRLKKF